MPLCDPDVIVNSACDYRKCIPPGAQGGVAIWILSRLYLVFNPTADVTPNALLNAACEFTRCIPPGDQAGVTNYLLCQVYDSISGGGGGGGLNCLLGDYIRPTVDDARMIVTQNPTCPPVRLMTIGMDSPDDGQGSFYYWDGNFVGPDTGLSAFYPDDNPYPGPGAWVQWTGVA